MAQAKTSVAAVFALVLGLIAMLCALTGVLTPVAIVFGIVGIIGRKKGAQAQRTGKGVATGGLVLAIIALVIGLLVDVAVVMWVTSPSVLAPVQQQISSLMSWLPRSR